MEGDLKKMPSDISGGVQKRVGLARALARSAYITAPDASHPGIASVARTPVFGVRGSSLAKAGNLKGRRLPSGSEARVSGRTADLKGGGLRYALRYARLNPAWESSLDDTRDKLKAKRFFEFVNPDDVGATRKSTVTKMSRSQRYRRPNLDMRSIYTRFGAEAIVNGTAERLRARKAADLQDTSGLLALQSLLDFGFQIPFQLLAVSRIRY